MEKTGFYNKGTEKTESIDPSKITAGQKYDTGLVFIYPGTNNAIDDVEALYTGWIIFNENVNKWQEAGKEAIKGNWDASGGTLPSTNIIVGDKYIISVAGVVSSIQLNENDTIIAKINNPSDTQTGGIFNDWTVVGAITVTSTNVSRPNGDSVEDSLVDLQNEKVDIVVGKQLSTEDYTTTEKNKLAGIAIGAQVNVKSDYNQTDNTQDDFIKNKPNLGTVASKNVGNQIGEVQENGAILGNLEIVETDAIGKLITVSKNTAYNKNFGTTNGDVARGDASYLKTNTYTQSEVDSLLNAKQNTANKGQPNGYASLDGSAKVPASQLPSYVDDVEEYSNLASFPTTGETGKIYIALDTNLTYRWSGSTYVSLNDVDLSDYFNKTTDTTDDITQGTAKFTTQADINKLAGIEANATTDQTDAEIKTAYENNTNTNAFTDAEQTKLAGIEQNATADQTDTEIKTAYENNADTNVFTDSEKTKLAGIAIGAEVNVQANLSQTDNLQDNYVAGKSTANIADSTDKRYVTDAQQTVLTNTSGTNTGDETTLSIQTKRPIKTVEGQSLEGAGNIDLTKSDVDLANVDNTSDANKPVSTAQQTALDNKEPSFTKNNAFNKDFGTTNGTVTQGDDSRHLVKRINVLIGASTANKKGVSFTYGTSISDAFFSLAMTSSNNSDAFCVKIIQITTTSAFLEVYRADGATWGDTAVACMVTIYSGTY